MPAERWRLLETGFKDAATNMALDQAILEAHLAGEVPPTLRLYGWTPSAVSIGYFQSLEDEVDLEACGKAGVEVVRRITGGGAVFHQREVTYSVSVGADHPKIPGNILESYKVILAGLIDGLGKMGVDAEFAPLNDVVSGGKKISGSAQTRRGGGVLQHGTLLLDVDVELMFSLLKVPEEKLRDKLIAAARERVTSTRHVLGREVPFDEGVKAMRDGFAKMLDVELEPGELTQGELESAGRIRKERFASSEWTRMR